MAKLEGTPPHADSCGCDGAMDNGCYNCTPSHWACGTCGWPVYVGRHGAAKTCVKCYGLDMTPEQVRYVAFSGRLPPEVKVP